MKTTAYLATMLVLLNTVLHAQQETSSPKNIFVLQFPQNADMTGLTVDPMVGGSFGGISEPPKVENSKCLIDLHGALNDVHSLQAIVLSPHYQTVLFTLKSWRLSAKIDLKPLLSVRLSGKVVLPDGLDASRFSIKVTYFAEWGMDFLGYIDGFPPVCNLGSVNLTKDGAFEIMVPDYVHDPVVASQKDKGFLQLLLREKKTGNHPYDLELQGDSDAGKVKIAAQYEPLKLRVTKEETRKGAKTTIEDTSANEKPVDSKPIGEGQVDTNLRAGFYLGENEAGTLLTVVFFKAPQSPPTKFEDFSINLLDSRGNKIPFNDSYDLHGAKILAEAGNGESVQASTDYIIHLKKSQKLASAELVWHGKKHIFLLKTAK